MDRYYIVILVVLVVDCCYGMAMRYEQATKIREIENSIVKLQMQLDNLKNGASAYDVNRDKRTQTLPASYKPIDGLTLRHQPADNVAFSALLVDDTTLSKDKWLIFDSASVNNANAYDSTTGLFTAPVKGTYVFALNIACSTGNYLELSIVKDRSVLFNTICKNLSTKEIHQNGGSTVALLEKGDKIHVEMIWPNNLRGTVTGTGLSSFSGFLLRAS